MKAVTALLLLSMGLFAEDGLHKYQDGEVEVCPTSEACVFTGAQSIQLIKDQYNFGGVNSDSALTDVMKSKDLCYVGEFNEVAGIFKALAGNENFSFFCGAHSAVEHIGVVKESKDYIRVVARIRSDYGDYDLNEKVFKCR